MFKSHFFVKLSNSVESNWACFLYDSVWNSTPGKQMHQCLCDFSASEFGYS